MSSFLQTLRKALTSKITFLIFPLLFSYLVIIRQDFPYLGLAISLALLSTSVALHKSMQTWFLKVIYLFSLIFCVFLVIRVNEFVTFLNIIAIFFMGGILITWPTKPDRNVMATFTHILTSPWQTFLGFLKTKSVFPIKWSFSFLQLTKKEQRSEKISNVLKSVIISVVLLAVILPLLSSTNPIFSSWLLQLTNIFNLTFLWELFNSDNIVTWVLRIFSSIILFITLPRLVTYGINPDDAKESRIISSSVLLIPKVVIAVVLALFFLSQTQFYFATNESLASLGYSHSEHSREVFGQLSLVALIVMGLIYNDKSTQKFARIMTYILCLEAFFLTGIAFKSVFDYSLHWGLTYKRLWGFTGVAWMVSALTSFLYTYHQQHKNSDFVKSIVVLSCLTLTLVNIANFDYLIYHYSKSADPDGIDLIYLSGLSSDSVSLKQQFETFQQIEFTPNEKENWSFNTIFAAQRISRRINFLQNKYQNVDWRSFNFAEYLQYQEIKSIETEVYDQKWETATFIDTQPHPSASPNISNYSPLPASPSLQPKL